MHGTIKALKYALGHELVYRDPAARLDRISKPVEPYRKVILSIPVYFNYILEDSHIFFMFKLFSKCVTVRFRYNYAPLLIYTMLPLFMCYIYTMLPLLRQISFLAQVTLHS